MTKRVKLNSVKSYVVELFNHKAYEDFFFSSAQEIADEIYRTFKVKSSLSRIKEVIRDVPVVKVYAATPNKKYYIHTKNAKRFERLTRG